MSNTVKTTKATMFTSIKDYLATTDWAGKEEAIEFIEKQLEQLASKAEKAKSRAEVKKSQGDALRQLVFSCVTDDPKTVGAIVEELSGMTTEEVTAAKVIARLTALCKAGLVEKEQVKVDKAKKMAYRIVESDTIPSKTIEIELPADDDAIVED